MNEFDHLESLRHALGAAWDDARDARDKVDAAMIKISGLRYQIQQRQIEIQKAALNDAREVNRD